MMKKNLCTDPWIPVLLCNGKVDMLGLDGLFTQMDTIRDLALSPKERIAVMRLLICITQRALDGPNDQEDHEECKERIISKVKEYLGKWHDAFEFQNGDGGFLQVPNLQPCQSAKGDDGGSMITKLDISLASGNNATLFDNAGGYERELSFSQIVLGLITFQNFAPAGTLGVVQWNGKNTGFKAPDNAKAGPCATQSALHLFLMGKNLLETVWMNLVPKERIEKDTVMDGVGVPVWEMMPESMDDEASQKNATRTYLGRLVPLSRCIRINDDRTVIIMGKCFEFPVYDQNGNVVWYELSTRRATTKKGIKTLISGSVERAVWRSLPALLMAGNDNGVSCIYENEELPEQFDLWVGALVLDKAKVLDEIESSFLHFEKSRLVSQTYAKQLADALEQATKWEGLLVSRVDKYCEFSGCEDIASQKKGKAKEIYWGKLGNRQDLFLQTAQTGDDALSETSKKEWENLIQHSCQEAYDAVCPHETERQLEAWVKGWNIKIKKSKKS